MIFKGLEGFWKGKKEFSNLIKGFWWRGKGKIMKMRDFSWEKKGLKTEVSFGKRGKGKRCLQQYSGLEISRISKCKMGTVVKFEQRIGMRPSRVFKSQQFLAMKFVPWRLKKFLASIWYNKFYSWLTVAPLGDGAFLKASRTSDLHSLGGWPMPHPLGCPSFVGMIFL